MTGKLCQYYDVNQIHGVRKAGSFTCQNKMKMSRTVRIITLGCAKNEVDTEEIAGVLARAGYRVDSSVRHPDVTVINTCGFLASAREEGLEVIRRAIRDKQAGKTGCVVVAGCLAQRYGERMVEMAPGADAYVGVGQMGRFAEILERTLAKTGSEALVEIGPPRHHWAEVVSRARSSNPWTAYLKISEGCDHRCAFCTIPSFRGRHTSKPLERILEEARYLVKTGAREINLVAQDTTQYGYDLYGEFSLPRLLGALIGVEGLVWLRVLYFYPSRLHSRVIEALSTLNKVVPYIDIPLQHAHPEILRKMRRPGDGEKYLRLLQRLRQAIPEVAVRTTFIVGFPGETEEHFGYLLDFLREAKFDRVGAFLYSREEGTPSYSYPEQVPEEIKVQRYRQLMETQQAISRDLQARWVGRKMEVLVEGLAEFSENGKRERGVVGRSYRDAPEVDGVVYLRGRAQPGDFVEAEITGSTEYDLVGEVRSITRPFPWGKRLRLAGQK